MNKNDNTTSHLSVSSKRLKNCDKIVQRLLELNVMSSVKQNKSVICNNYDCWLEYGCDITLTGLKSNLKPDTSFATLTGFQSTVLLSSSLALEFSGARLKSPKP